MATLRKGPRHRIGNIKRLKRVGHSESRAQAIASAYAGKAPKPRPPRVKRFVVQGIGW